MGSERLKHWLALVLALAACVPTARPPDHGASAPAVHAQVVRAMPTAARRLLVQRFRERNGTEWGVNEDALDRSLTVVDPFRGFLRRVSRPDPGGTRVSAEDARSLAFGFVKANADLLGLSASSVLGLQEDVRTVLPPWLIHFDGRFSVKGYEGFHELDTTVDIDVVVNGGVIAVINRSLVHPRLVLDLHPALDRDERVVHRLVGRRVFALRDEPTVDERSRTRIPLGEIHAEDVTNVALVIHVSTGPQLAWLVYRLAYAVELARPTPGAEVVPVPVENAGFYFFRYVVDADTGEVVEDSKAPIVAADEEP